MSDSFRNRQITIQVFFFLVAMGLVYQAFRLQVMNSTFKAQADASTMDKYILYPGRGLIYDRNDVLLVNNNPMYDLMVTYNQVDPKMDTSLFCEILGLDVSSFENRLNKNWKSQRFSKTAPFVFLSKIPDTVGVILKESLYQFPGFYVQERNARGYPQKLAAHVLGYIREVNRKEIEDSVTIYQSGDYIGASGLELQYEYFLRGEKGARYILKDNLGREMGKFNDGNKDIDPVSGKDLYISLDAKLQAYGEKLMQNKVGSIVAIEPSSGEILAMVSSPTYDPNLLTINKDRGKAYQKLAQDSLEPFFDRSIMAQYPPGSLFKSVVALIGMEEETLSENKTVYCGGGYIHNGARLVGCHGHPTCTNVGMAIQHSCNAYFVTAFRDIIDKHGFYNPEQGLDVFNDYLYKFGLGHPLGIDFPREKIGNYPTSTYYTDYFNRQQEGQRWNSIWIRSVGIGQGELLMTNLQMANLAAILANRGYYITPHFVKKIKDIQGNEITFPRYYKKQEIGIDSAYYEPVVDGMEKVVTSGTARSAFIPGIPVCGKTGTAENNQGNQKDHSVFFAFAPKVNPTIAIVAYVENAGWGGSFAAPIASLMIEKSINDTISHQRKYLEQRMLDANLIDTP